MNFERRYFDSKIKDGKAYKISSSELRHTNVEDFKNGDVIYVGEKYEIELVKEKYRTFSMQSRVMNAMTFAYIDPAFWPVYINNFLHGDYRR